MVSHSNNLCSGVVNRVLLYTFGNERAGLWLHHVIFLERVMVALKRKRKMVSHSNNLCSGVVNHVLLNTFGVEREGLWLHHVIFLESDGGPEKGPLMLSLQSMNGHEWALFRATTTV